MTILTDNVLPSELISQQAKAWQQFTEQSPDLATVLSDNNISDFKLFITLSDFALRSALQAPDIVVELFTSGEIYQVTATDYRCLLKHKLRNCCSEAELHQQLRLFRLKHMAKIAFGDFLLNAPLEHSLSNLSNLADALILAALDWLSQHCQQKWGKPLNQLGELQPLLVYGMGKLGGRELNFSSDIDLIFAYPGSGQTQGQRRSIDNQQFFTRLAQKLITALHQPTQDGFVYRVDMRLRPFGDSGPLVLSFNAIENYYQEQGRDWERYAMLKARLIGNSDYHQALSSMLRPFVYRRYIDFSVIDSLRRMKMMISQEVRRKQLINNIKLGAGGIREVEFIVQVFQLIRGGRIKALQQRNLLTVLPLLVEYGEIEQANKTILENAYRFLRRVENIIQALDDQQTQTLPENSMDQARLLCVLNDKRFASWSDLVDYINQLMSGVHQEFLQLIGEESPEHQVKDNQWQVLWDSHWPDEEAIEWINNLMTHWQGELIWRLLSSFRQDIAKCSIGHRGRDVLAKLLPLLLSHLQQLKADELTLERVLTVLTKITSRTAYLELLLENSGALIHLITLCQASSWVAEHIAKYPILLDELIDPNLLHNPPALSNYADELRTAMLRIPESDLEAQMDTLRHFKQAQHLRIAVADIVGVLPVTKVSDHLTALAEAIINEVMNLSWQQMAWRFGIPTSLAGNADKNFAVIAYGKMGGYELGYSSDLDLVFVHDCQLNELTNGDKVIPVAQFYGKIAQRMMHFFNTRMSSGLLFELDLRLRPSGNAGVLVVHIDTFAEYQQHQAWTWEHQALVRARGVAGDSQLLTKFSRLRKNILAVQRQQDNLKQDVIAMRNKMRKHLDKSNSQYFDIKQAAGGLVDIEFLAQYLVLNNSQEYPEISQYTDNIRVFNALADVGLITKQQKTQLIKQYCQLRDYGHRQSLQFKVSKAIPKEMVQQAEQISKIYHEYLS